MEWTSHCCVYACLWGVGHIASNESAVRRPCEYCSVPEWQKTCVFTHVN